MNLKLDIKKLQAMYPNSPIILNSKKSPSEIICEIAPTQDHPEYSHAIAVIDKSTPDLHRITTGNLQSNQGQTNCI